MSVFCSEPHIFKVELSKISLTLWNLLSLRIGRYHCPMFIKELTTNLYIIATRWSGFQIHWNATSIHKYFWNDSISFTLCAQLTHPGTPYTQNTSFGVYFIEWNLKYIVCFKYFVFNIIVWKCMVFNTFCNMWTTINTVSVSYVHVLLE